MRIDQALNVLKEHLSAYDELKNKVDLHDVGSSTATSIISLTLVKVAEEHTLRNGPRPRIYQNRKPTLKNRPVFTNLFVLFSCNTKTYSDSLQALSKVVEFFQGKNVFTHLDGIQGHDGKGKNKTNKFKLIVELQDLSFEQISNIWSSLGGKQHPSVLYKVRMIPLEAVDKQYIEGEPILDVVVQGNANY